MIKTSFNWQQSIIIVAGVIVLLVFLVRSFLTGEDIPGNFQIIIGAIFGFALGGAGISALVKKDKKDEPEKKEVKDD